MSLTRSASGPGGLSINTGAANLFGANTSQPPPAGGLLGGSTSATATSQPAQTGTLFGRAPATTQQTTLFGSTTAASQPQQTGGLFGTSTPAATQAQQTPGLFGTTSTAAAQPQQSGSVFGSLPVTSQPQQTGGLFGSAPAASQPQQTGGLFGSTLGQPQKTGGLFGSTLQPPPQQQQQQTGGLFASGLPSQPAQTGGLFGGSTQQQPAATSGLFGMGPSTGTGGLFGGPAQPAAGNFGQPRISTNLADESLRQNQANQFAAQSMLRSVFQPGQLSQTIPGVRIDGSNIRGTTRFNDLHESIQNEIAMYDQIIENIMAQKSEVDAFMPAHGEQIAAIPPDVRFVSRKADGVDGALAGDAQAIKALRELVRVDADHARLSFKAVDNLKLPAQYHTAGLWSTRTQGTTPAGADGEGDNSDLVSFFSTTADEMADTMRKFGQNLTDIEAHLRGAESSLREQMSRLAASSKVAGQNEAEERITQLAAVLTDFETSILQVAGQVGGAREKMTELQLGEFIGNGANGAR